MRDLSFAQETDARSGHGGKECKGHLHPIPRGHTMQVERLASGTIYAMPGRETDSEKLAALIEEARELRKRADKLLDQSEALRKKIAERDSASRRKK